jgi:type IV secretory pathway VirJ component
MKLSTLGLVLLLAVSAASDVHAATDDGLEFGRFGRVTLVRATPQPAHVVLFVSGDGGWKSGVVDMAKHLAANDALVVGIDIRHYLKAIAAARESCAYSAADFEALSQYVQQSLGYPRYVTPILAGYSSGATLVYALLAQAPPGTFGGALSLGFCPDLPGKAAVQGSRTGARPGWPPARNSALQAGQGSGVAVDRLPG